MTVVAKAKRLFVMWKEGAGLNYSVNLLLALGGLNDSRMVIHYSVKVSGGSVSADVKGAEEF